MLRQQRMRIFQILSVLLALSMVLPAGVGATTTAPAPMSPEACIDTYTPENSGTTHDGADTLDKCVTGTFTSNATTKRIVVFYTDTENTSKHRSSQTNAQDVLDAAIEAWQAYVAQGFNEPRHNGGQGNNSGGSNDKDNRFDVWIEHDNGDGWWGIAWWYPTDHVSIHAPLARLAEGTALKRDATVYHEIFHRVQYSYDFTEVHDNYSGNAWMVEGGARHMQDEVSSAVDDDVDGRFRSAANSYLGQPQKDLRDRSYIAGFWWKFLSEQLGENAGDPGLGTDAVETFWDKTLTDDEMDALSAAVVAEGGGNLNSFFQRFTTANYTKDYTSADSDYYYVDDDAASWNTVNLSENRSPGASGYYNESRNQEPWAARYFQLNLTSSCDVVNYTFTSTSGDTLGFDVVTVDGSNNLVDHWSSVGTGYNKSFINDGYSKAVGIVTTYDSSADYDVDFGCVTPSIVIERPQQLGAGSPALVGPHDDPTPFTVRLQVNAAGSASLSGLEAADFSVTVGGDAAPVLGSAYVLDRYWLSIDTPFQASDGVYDLDVELLGVASDSEPQSVLYSTLGQNDVIHVLDVSGSMAPDKFSAAKEAYKLLVNEVATDDFGGLVKFSGDGTELEWNYPGWGAQNNDASTVFSLQVIPDDATRDALRSAADPLGTENWTSIGDGLMQAVDEYTSNGNGDHLCTVVLLSDGDENEGMLYENDPVNPGKVADSLNAAGCRVDTVAFGPQANEELMQIIAGAHSGDYYYAPYGGVKAPDAIAWQNELARNFDQAMTKAAGRQRIQSFFGSGDQGITRKFFVSEFDDFFMLALKWINPGTPGQAMWMEITDPEGKPLNPDPRCGPYNYPDSPTERFCSETNEVARITKPKIGWWTVELQGEKPSDYVLMGNVRSGLRLDLASGEAAALFSPGTTIPAGYCVPIVGLVTAPNIGPVAGATVQATVEKPGGGATTLPLFDDGLHQDGLADDGAYANRYCDTSAADLPASAGARGKQWTEGEEPVVRGSYMVEGVALWRQIRREDRTSFVMAHDADDDSDGMPNTWEASIDPTWVTTPNAYDDPDFDSLLNIDEFHNGTHPLIADTDRGGENDGSEVTAGRDPLNPTDDVTTPVLHFDLLADNSLVRLFFTLGDSTDAFRIWRRTIFTAAKGPVAEDWQLLYTGDGAPGEPVDFYDQQVFNGESYEYRVQSLSSTKLAGAEGGYSGILTATPKNDPVPPVGTVEINESQRNTMGSDVRLIMFATDPDVWEETEGPATLRTHGLAPNVDEDPTEMRFSNDGAFPEDPDLDWVPYDVNYLWNLGAPDSGPVTVFVEFRDEEGNISQAPASDSIFFCQPDLDNDKLIEASDIQQFADRWGAAMGDGQYGAVYDMDGDLDVDIADIMMAAGFFGDTCS